MKAISLFSGVGMFDLGVSLAGFDIIAQVEIDEFCRRVLKRHARNTGLTQRSLWMSEGSDDTASEETLTSSMAGSPANLTASPVVEKAKAMTETCGRNFAALLARYDRDQSCWKMLPGLPKRIRWRVKYDPHTHSQLLLTLPRWGMTHDGGLYLLPTPERLTSVTGGGAWPTPVASDCGNRQPGNVHHTTTGTIRHVNADGEQSFMSLSQVVKVRAWSTPTAQDVENSTLPTSQMDRDALSGDVMRNGGDTVLNPEWVEQLMGLPKGWTHPDGPPIKVSRSTSGKRPGRSLRTRQITGARVSRRSVMAASGRLRTGLQKG